MESQGRGEGDRCSGRRGRREGVERAWASLKAYRRSWRMDPHVILCRKSVPGRGNSLCKGLETGGLCRAFLVKASVARANQ